MMRSEAVTECRELLGFNNALAEDVIVRALYQAQLIAESDPELPSFIESEMAFIDTIPDEERVPLPTDYIIELEDSALYYYKDDGSGNFEYCELTKWNADANRNTYNALGRNSGAPEMYSLDGKYLRLFPTPDAIYRIYWRYYKQDALLTSDIENEWLKRRPWLIIARAVMLLASKTDDDKVFQRATSLYGEQREQMMLFETAKEIANTRYVMGGEPD